MPAATAHPHCAHFIDCIAGLHLKVHKIEIFFSLDFEICNISWLVMSNIDILQKMF